jgi:hypothetical protein
VRLEDRDPIVACVIEAVSILFTISIVVVLCCVIFSFFI